MTVAKPVPQRKRRRGRGRVDKPSTLLSSEELINWYSRMLLARALSERIWQLNRQGKVHLAITCQGHEAAQIGSASAIRAGLDVCLPYYRDLAVMLTLGMSARVIMLNALAKRDDPNSGGRQMPGHWSWPEKRVMTLSSPVANHIPHAAGMALAAKLRGESNAVIVYFGDGATSRGDFHEGLNFASVHKLPVVFFCENNRYAISVPFRLQTATSTISEKAAAYGMPGVAVDGRNPLAVYDATTQALERAHRGEGPTLIEARVVRLTPHTSNDDDSRYKSPKEIEQERSRDPLPWFRDYLIQREMLDEESATAIQRSTDEEVESATQFAEQNADPDPADLHRHVFFTPEVQR